AIITTTEAQVPTSTTATLTADPVRAAVAPSRKRKGVVLRDPEEDSTTSTIIPAKTKSKARCTCSNLEKSKNCTWSSKGQELEATGIMWCTNHNLYNHKADFVSGKKVPTLKIYSRPDAECCKTLCRGGE
nr:hypothetical protein [Tanacetum cinerariifolium]